MDRFFCLLYFVGAAYAAQTTPDTNVTSFSAVVQTAEVLNNLTALPTSSDEGITVVTTDSPLRNEVVDEVRGTVGMVRSTETSISLDLDLSTRTTSVDPEEKRVEANTVSLPTEATEAREAPLRPETTTSHSLPPQAAHRASPTTQTSSPTTTLRPPEQDVTVPRRPTSPSPVEGTTKAISSITRPNRKSSPAEAKKGTINAGLNHHTKKRKPSKKDNGMSSLVYIPLIIQAQMIPMMLLQLKFFALKALALGKLALILLGFNLLRNAIIGYNNDEQQYEHESLASAHYGYNGGPEYGSWVNRRMYKSSTEFIRQNENHEINSRNRFQNKDKRNNSRFSKMENGVYHIGNSNDPYRGHKHQQLEKSIVYTR